MYSQHLVKERESNCADFNGMLKPIDRRTLKRSMYLTLCLYLSMSKYTYAKHFKHYAVERTDK